MSPSAYMPVYSGEDVPARQRRESAAASCLRSSSSPPPSHGSLAPIMNWGAETSMPREKRVLYGARPSMGP